MTTDIPFFATLGNPTYLGVGDTYSQTINVPLPINIQQTWYIYVYTDYSASMPEVSRTNNTLVSPGFKVTLSPPPDLAVASVQAPPQNFSGQPMNVSWTVTNSGAGQTAATSWNDAVYMSPDPTLNSNATLLGNFGHSGALAAGASYTNNQTVTLPNGVSGQYYILVNTDSAGQVFENGELGDNVAATSVPVNINLTPPPDLTASIVTAPSTALASHTLSFTYQVTNLGAGPVPNSSWTDSFYLSPTPTFDPNTAISLGHQSSPESLDSGDGYTATFNATLPNGISGPYYLFVDTDSSNVVSELNKSNNLSSPVELQIASQPADLTVLPATAPSNAGAGSSVLVHWTVANQGIGDTAVSSWTDNVYIDTGSTLDGNKILLGSFSHVGPLAPGGSYNQAQSVTLPGNLSGNYNLFVVTNANNSVFEGSNSLTDVSAPVPINIEALLLSDLVVSSVVAPAAVVTGGTGTVTWTVTNTGIAATNASSWSDRIWLSTNPTIGSGGTDLKLASIRHVGSLAIGANYTTAATVSLPNSLRRATTTSSSRPTAATRWPRATRATTSRPPAPSTAPARRRATAFRSARQLIWRHRPWPQQPPGSPSTSHGP